MKSQSVARDRAEQEKPLPVDPLGALVSAALASAAAMRARGHRADDEIIQLLERRAYLAHRWLGSQPPEAVALHL